MVPMPFTPPSFRLPILAALSALFCGGAMAFTALQFDATVSRSVSRTDGFVTAWVSTRGGIVANPCHTNGVGWASPQYNADGGIDFRVISGAASPFFFAMSETGLVSRAFIVADGGDATANGTLLDAPCSLRILPVGDDGTAHFSTSSVLSSLALSIDFAAGTAYSAGPHLYEIALAESCPLCDLHIGGSPATPAWNRSWNGAVREVVLAAPGLTGNEAAAIRSFLSKKWEIGAFRAQLPDELGVIRALGIRPGSVYRSMMILR